MDTYGVLRELDYLKVAVDNLLRETMKFLPHSTQPGNIPEESKPATTIPELFKEQTRRIDCVAEALKNFMLPNVYPYERTTK